ncbi:MAG TPA: hypothetical protein DEG17_15895 [Cyanobacteria bacterium UBA11149]|nr:hypothetical protein [Cyanobacteria bacterium UBA11367]HBE56206.1 hypothetical protein [Cyanobacteria bacterium UBA11366]HBK66991.1 hypothetical protein [Cyanobacteria bacterium UBA11166]HBR75613.1 hypothetical protein [Cyanobacteria bacterium UBA11159]HBS68469.1 hypothetical protein [Cyanobacteria bacterium UBA11153]HBW90312.1 hypothetical protein [Cyanobacteria bacterium UBA11149]HCA95433.1 hypothetical protein [Cyanobacteria bacterium UBA9226]
MNNLPNTAKQLTYQGIYPCPICRISQIQAMPLMDAMACNSCRHIFIADLDKQILKMTDRHPPLTWRWNGKKWLGGHLEGLEWGWMLWILSIAFVILPTTLICLSTYTFPPDPHSRFYWFPIAWIGLTFLSHLGIILWLVMEFYQFPMRMYLRMRLPERWHR